MDFNALPPGTRIVDGKLVVPASASGIVVRVKGNDLEQPSPVVGLALPAATGTGGGLAAGSLLPAKVFAAEPLPSFTAVAILHWAAYRYDPTNRAHAHAYGGFTEASALPGELCRLRQQGTLTFPVGTALTPGQRYLAAAEGRLAVSPAPGDLFTRALGVAMSPTELYLFNSPPIFLL